MENKTAVITGCNRGLGSGIRDILLSNNFTVYGLNRNSKNEFTNDIDINSFMNHYKSLKVDVSSYKEVEKMCANLPKIDLLVLNAGVRRFSEIKDMNIKDWDDSVNTNLNGVFYVAKELIPNVIHAKGDIIVIGSHSEKYTFEMGSAYCSTKGALKEFAEVLMQEVRYEDVRVSYLSLGSIKNRDHGIDEEWKLKPIEVGETVYRIHQLPKNVMIPYLDVRPIKPLKDSRPGIEKLQYV